MTESLLCRDRLFTGQVQVRIRLCVEQGGEELKKPIDVSRRNWLVIRRGFVDRTRQEYGSRGVLKNTREVIHQSICTFSPDVDDPQGNLSSMMGRRFKRRRTFTARGPYFEWCGPSPALWGTLAAARVPTFHTADKVFASMINFFQAHSGTAGQPKEWRATWQFHFLPPPRPGGCHQSVRCIRKTYATKRYYAAHDASLGVGAGAKR